MFQYKYILVVLLCSCFVRKEGDAQNKTVNLGGLEWSLENSSVKRLRDGKEIKQARSKSEWKKAYSNGEPAWCYLNFDEANKSHGLIYNASAIQALIKSPPKGYRVPTEADWLKMLESVKKNEMDLTAGIRLKSTEGWQLDSVYEKVQKNGNNASGFTARPCGYIVASGVHIAAHQGVSYWVATTSKPKGLTLARYYSHYQLIATQKMEGRYLRFIKTTPTEELMNDALKIDGHLWMPANADYTHYQNGDPIPYAETEKEWIHYCSQGIGAYCYKFFDEELGKPHGKLYNVFATRDVRGLLPKGWSIPTHDDFDKAVTHHSFRKCYFNQGIIEDKVNKRGKILKLGGVLDCWTECKEDNKYPNCYHSVRNGSNGSTSGKTEACGVRGIKK